MNGPRPSNPVPSKSSDDGSGAVDEVTVRKLEPKGLAKPNVPGPKIGVSGSLNVTDLKGQPNRKLVCTSYSEAGLIIATNATTQPSEPSTPVTDSLRRDEITVVVVRKEGTSNDQANVEGVLGPFVRDVLNV